MSQASYSLRDWNDVDRSFRVVASTSKPLKRSEWDPKTEKQVEFYEALEGWNFDRFKRNPLFLESHCTNNLDAALGTCSDIKETEDGGLELKVTLGPANANPRIGQLEQRIKSGLARGVSVGWDYGDRTDEQRGGKTVRVYRNNLLSEVSLCLIPADEDALVEADDGTEETRKKERVSNAGRLLARARATRTDADEDRFDFVSAIGKFTRTQVGGIRVPARLTRTGVLEYKRPDGTIRRELRLPSEVFNSDSLATLTGATVTDLDHHRGLLDVSNWKDATLGHAEEIRKDGDFVSADLVINDARAIAAIENGQLRDISCGYRCKLRHEPGVYNGERYDCIQFDIRYNHVAVLPRGRGRAGTDVSLRLDSKQAECVELDATTEEQKRMEKVIIRLDGKDMEYGSKEHISHIEGAHLKDLEKFETEKKTLVERCDKADGDKKVAEKKAADLEKDKEGETERSKTRMKKRLKLYRSYARAFMDDEEDEEKTDARLDALDDKSERDIMVEIIRSDARWKDDKLESDDGKPLGEEAIAAIYRSVSKDFKRSDGIDSVVDTIERVKRTDGGDKDPAAESRAKMNKDLHEAWTKPLT
jgi:HK97 family phage prohead protease